MKNNLLRIFVFVVVLTSIFTSCNKDLDRTPTNETTADAAYSSAEGYKQALAKVYGSYALTGSSGPNSTDLGGIDPGTSDFLRLYWVAQEITTDEAMIIWSDPGLPEFHNLNWSSSNVMLTGLYNRCLYQITVCNEFIREASDGKLSSRGITGTAADSVRFYRAEARFLRAFQYWVVMDLFANPPFVTETDPIGSYLPKQISRANLFNYIESELKAIEGGMIAPRQNEYGRVDQAAVWALLARLYLNAEVYLGQGNGRFTDAITYASKVINSGYTLSPNYRYLFLADNNTNNNEILLPINYDGVFTQNWGGTTFIINAAINNELNPPAFGVPTGGWGGMRSTKNLPLLFGDYSGNTDKRAMFAGFTLEITDPSVYKQGLAVVKFKNITSTGATPSSANGTFASTDFPLFRLSEMYLVYAEAVLRGGAGGSMTTALQFINSLRTRAFGNTGGNLNTLTLNDILDERGRELYWEAYRRTDLIRFGIFTSASYLWPWKGGVQGGRGVDPKYNIFPIPATDIIANPNLAQNTGY
jgi:starch-binding outer membrane protein, SusD/RagB family